MFTVNCILNVFICKKMNTGKGDLVTVEQNVFSPPALHSLSSPNLKSKNALRASPFLVKPHCRVPLPKGQFRLLKPHILKTSRAFTKTKLAVAASRFIRSAPRRANGGRLMKVLFVVWKLNLTLCFLISQQPCDSMHDS